MIPAWLYLKRGDPFGGVVWRFGSRRPLRVVLTIISGGDIPPHVLLGVGKLGVQFGVVDGIDAGHAGMPPGSKCRLWEFGRRGRAVGVSWDGGT